MIFDQIKKAQKIPALKKINNYIYDEKYQNGLLQLHRVQI